MKTSGRGGGDVVVRVRRYCGAVTVGTVVGAVWAKRERGGGDENESYGQNARRSCTSASTSPPPLRRRPLSVHVAPPPHRRYADAKVPSGGRGRRRQREPEIRDAAAAPPRDEEEHNLRAVIVRGARSTTKINAEKGFEK